MKIHPRATAGFSLVEVALAMGIAVFCLVTLFGLLPVGVNTNRGSFEQTAAVNIASAVIADLRSVTLTTSATDKFTTPRYGITIPATPPVAGKPPEMHTIFLNEDGSLVGKADNDLGRGASARYRATIYYTATNSLPEQNPVSVRVSVTWPPVGDPAWKVAPKRYSGSHETVTTLVRN